MEKEILLYFLVEFQSVDIYCLPRRFYRHEYFSGFDSYPGVFNLDPVIGAISLLDEFWQSTQTMFSMTAMVTDHGTPSLSSVVPVYVSFKDGVFKHCIMKNDLKYVLIAVFPQVLAG